MEGKLFDDLTSRQAKKLYKAAHLRHMNQGEIVLRKGEPGGTFFLVLTGKVVVVDELHGRKSVLAELHGGDCFGEMAPFSHTPRCATVLCNEAGHLLVIDEDRLTRLAEHDLYPEFLEEIVTVLADRLRRTNALYMQAKYGETADVGEGGSESTA